MPISSQLRVQDIRFLNELVGECRDLGDDPREWRVHWFAQLGNRVGADLVIGGETSLAPDRVQVLGTVDWGWENGLNRRAWLEIMSSETDLSSALVIGTYFQRLKPGENGECLTRTDLLRDREWYSSRAYEVQNRPVGIDHMMVCFRTDPTMGGDFNGVTLSRARQKNNDFTARDKRLVKESHALLMPYLGNALTRFHERSPWELAPRARQVLECILEGDSDKQIAKRLRISPFTVNHYTKVIFQHFHVQSRTELLALWIRRLHRGRFPWAAEPKSE